MTLKEKKENFYQTAIDSATEHNIAIVNDYIELLSKETETIKQQIVERLDEKRKYEMEQMLRQKNVTLAKKATEIRHQYSDLVLSLRDSMFDKVKEQIIEFCKTEEYQMLLAKQMKEALSGCEDEYIIYVVDQDVSFVKQLNLGEKATVVASDEDFWGGFKVEFVHKQMIINQTYALKFVECKHDFKVHSKA